MDSYIFAVGNIIGTNTHWRNFSWTILQYTRTLSLVIKELPAVVAL